MEARRKVNNNGSISCTASRVAGREPLKIITPSIGFRQKRPRLVQLVPLIIISSGVVIGFPLLTALANKHNRMRRGDALQGQRREQGKADHHP
jgi:hypothetical protein